MDILTRPLRIVRSARLVALFKFLPLHINRIKSQKNVDFFTYLEYFLNNKYSYIDFEHVIGKLAMLTEEKLQAFEEVCRKVGLKITHQRLEIFKELLNSQDHPTVEKLYRRLQPKLPTISLDTVYRTLTTLEQHGLVSRVQSQESQARFEGKMEEHHHAICKKCGMITDFYWKFPDEEKLPREILNWGQIVKKSLTLHGLCEQCLQQE